MKLTNVRVREQLKVFTLSIECSRTYLFMRLSLKEDTDSKRVVLLDAFIDILYSISISVWLVIFSE